MYYLQLLLLLSEAWPLELHLAWHATFRLSHAFSDSTKKAYATLFKTFVAFVVFMHWDLPQATVLKLLCFYNI